MNLRISVGMALFDKGPEYYESARAAFTIRSLMMHHRERVGEIVVVNNNPDPLNPLAEWPGKTDGFVRYEDMAYPVGTSAPRDRVFELATCDYVMVIDPHVLVNTLAPVEDFYAEHGAGCPDILHGTLVTEADKVYGHHMNDQWRDQMLGTWGKAWEARPGKHAAGAPRCFSVVDPGDHICRYVSLDDDGTEQRELTRDEVSALGLPPTLLSFFGHEKVLEGLGFRPPTSPFRVPGHGMGLWVCRKDSWIPFHERCRGFGGEEITTGKRFRRAGRNAWTLPGLRWWHHFHRPAAAYSLNQYDRIRNYCLEFQRLGLDPKPIWQHFFEGKNHGDWEWQAALRGDEWPTPPAHEARHPAIALTREEADRVHARQPVSEQDKLAASYIPVPGQPQATATGDMEGMYRNVVAIPSPYNLDMPNLRHLAAVCGGDRPGRVVEVVHQASSAIALVAARPASVSSYGGMPPYRVTSIQNACPKETSFAAADGIPKEIPECDLLFLDVDPHTGLYYRQLLDRYAARCARYVAVHDSIAYRDRWNDEPGLMTGIEGFVRDNPEWRLVGEYRGQNGLLVLSRDSDDAELPATPPELFAAVAPPPNVEGTQPAPAEGVGTELKAILAGFGINPAPGCECNARAAEMNRAGVEWVKTNKATVVGWMKEGAERWGWASVGMALVTHPIKAAKLAKRVAWSDPWPGLVDLAVENYEKSQLEEEDAA